MTKLFAFAGVDYVQWRAVTRALLRTDFRVPLAQSGEAYSFRTLKGLAMLVVVHVGIGLASAIVVILNRDVVLTGTVVLAYLTFVIGTALLTQHGATLLATTDYAILGPRPVSSRTFLAIRLTNVLLHTWLLAALMSLAPVLAFTLAHGPSVARGAAALVAIFAWSTALALALAAGYGTLLRAVGAWRLQRVLAYVQLVAGMLVYGGVIIGMRVLAPGAAATVRMLDEPWPWLLPPAWFAGYMAVATGDASGATWARAAASILALAVLVSLLRGRLSADYAERLGETMHAGLPLPALPPRRARELPLLTALFNTGESRAVAILVLAHFRHDLRVRMGVLGILPLIVFYLLLGAEHRAPDPFLGPPDEAFDYIGLAILLFPALLTQQFSSSDAYRAAWIYHATPSDRSRLVIALKNVSVVYFLVPFLLIVAGVFAWRFAHVGHAAAHTAMLGLISHLALLGSVALSPRLPFASPPDKMSGSARLFMWLMFVLVGGQLLMWALPLFVYISWTRVTVLAAGLVALTFALDRIVARRARVIPS